MQQIVYSSPAFFAITMALFIMDNNVVLAAIQM